LKEEILAYGQRWYIRTSSSIPPFLGVYPNFVYPPIFGGINELLRISSDVSKLYEIARMFGGKD
jgi:hypothetical protein